MLMRHKMQEEACSVHCTCVPNFLSLSCPYALRRHSFPTSFSVKTFLGSLLGKKQKQTKKQPKTSSLASSKFLLLGEPKDTSR